MPAYSSCWLGWDATGEAYAMVTEPAGAALDAAAAAALVLGLVLAGAALVALHAASATSAADPAAMTRGDRNRFLGSMNRAFLGR